MEDEEIASSASEPPVVTPRFGDFCGVENVLWNHARSYLINPRYLFSQMVENMNAVSVSGRGDFDSNARFPLSNSLQDTVS